ncbi:GntR family transcriptional regulator [Bacillus sp. ISL-40]|uniref:TrkA C-terminal domain-containing protein n=1 Tax=unclassified Bacillus (in: firmicutes) TaxID=185979 RepID=UPI001BE8AB57|nr:MULTISPECIES: TrkA C-terminal domain-containing protein [unclassified Bacillus (in: firmicutes)]MBT2699188.1 GntR family transcriptional regulator [Bacillus sp. ISL-40]MBT2723545.1 GntR family transcriptional regulator [Bacillus sp. ISL-46]MBT2739616.1 GntR family transcriptional regulator [Bacillus sp. ISL-77]
MQKAQIPTYERIAIDLANRIYDGKFKVGEKIHGRSTLASEYKVSPETVRRAIKILEDVEIVQSTKGSGIVISSRENAYKYIQRFSNIASIKDLEKQMNSLISERDKLDEQLFDTLRKIMDYSGKLRHTNPLAPIEVEVFPGCIHIGQTISELKFWQNTGGTVIGMKRKGELIISPGPYAVILEGDVLLIIGAEETHDRVIHFMEE